MKKSLYIAALLIFGIVSVLALSCSRKLPVAVENGSSKVAFEIRFNDNVQSLSGIRPLLKSMEIIKVIVTISASDMTTLSKEMTRSDNTFTGNISVPMGNSRTFKIEAFDAANIVQYQGSTTQNITQSEEQVSIELSGVYPQPVILEISAYSGKSVTLKWNASTAKDFSFYRITRSNTNVDHDINDHRYTDISTKSIVIFTDNDITPGSTYYYTIWVVDTEGLGYGSSTKTVTTPTYLFKANFQSGWMDNWEKAFIYISDLNGNVWGESEITTSTQTVTFDIPSEFMLYPDRISVTTVVKGTKNIHIESNLDNPIGTTWTYKVYPSDQLSSYQGDVTMNFANVPEHSGYIVSSLWNHNALTANPIYNPYVYDIYTSPVDVYIKINTTASGPKYMWLNDASPGDYNVDLANLTTLQTSTVTYPAATEGIRTWLYGYPIAGERYRGYYCIDRQSLNGISTESVNLVYPADKFTDFSTSLYEYDMTNSNSYWRQVTYGEISSEFERINAEFNIVNTTPDNFKIQSSGSFDEIYSGWSEYDVGMDGYLFWDVYGPPELTVYQLPDFSSLVADYIGSKSASDFELDMVEITDYIQIDTYQQQLDIFFGDTDYFFNVVPGYRLLYKAWPASLKKEAMQNSPQRKGKRTRDYDY